MAGEARLRGQADVREGYGGQPLTAEQVPARRRVLTIDNRFLPPILITCILLGANLSFGILEGWERTALSIAVAIGTVLAAGAQLCCANAQ